MWEKDASMGGLPATRTIRSSFTQRAALFSLLIGLLLPYSLPAAANANTRQVIPFEMDSQDRLVTELSFENGATATAVIDTAATLPMIGGATARSADAGVILGNEQFVEVLGLGGPEVFPLIDLPSLGAGSVALERVAVALDSRIAVSGVSNVLPISALVGDVVDFDFDEGRVTAYDRRPEGRMREILCKRPLEVRNGLYFVKVTINGRRGLALIDTGSTITYMNSTFAAHAGTKVNEEETKRLLGITGDDFDMHVARVSRFELDEVDMTGFDMVVSDPALFEYLGMADEPVMILGMDFLSQFRVQIDRKNNLLYLRIRHSVAKKCLVCMEVRSYRRR
jgi:Aspartyl protease